MAQLLKSTTIGGVSLLDFFYPVGTIYMTSDDDFDPSVQWGGTWQRLANRFIYGRADDGNASGTTGGESTHKLTISEMPSHQHTYERQAIWYSELDNTSTSLGDKTDLANIYKALSDSTGGGQAHNNMPPYYVANIWRRTA